MAAKIPGKEEFKETLRYFKVQLAKYQVEIKLSHKVTSGELLEEHYDHIVIATGVQPRTVSFDGVADNPKVVSYADVITGKVLAGKKVAIIGAGGIGFDIAEFLLHDENNLSTNVDAFLDYWGIDKSLRARSGIEGVQRKIPSPSREIYLMQRKAGRLGEALGKTTGWIHRQILKDGQVKMLSGVEYLKVDNNGIIIRHEEEEKHIVVDHIVVCAGQVSVNSLYEELKNKQTTHCHLIGGAALAAELDAKRAIREGIYLARSF